MDKKINDDPSALQAIDQQREEMDLGPSGEFPEGVINEHDEGAMQYAISTLNGKVLFNFGKPAAWFTMNSTQAREAAYMMIAHADSLDAKKG